MHVGDIMQWRGLVIICVMLCSALAEPEPKKFKPELKENEQDSTLTNEERTFLREVESKFGIKSEVPLPSKEDKQNEKTNNDKESNISTISGVPGPGFPAVIAIEIVNDTDTKTKGKRTIDANLGYGYRTNNGYMYSYFGKPSQDMGKFMIYPYSQQDIPPTRASHYKDSNAEYSHTSPSRNRYSSQSVVEIQPSQAFELVPIKEGEDSSESYQYNKHNAEVHTNYENVKGLVSPPPPYPDIKNSVSQAAASPSTLYTTYNGQQFSGLQGQFPMVMSNYLVDPSQLLQNPQYQSSGLTQDHFRSQGQQLEQRVVPVLVLRIPSSYLKNPTAELYANLPQNYPLSQYLNNVNLQALVNQYFKKIGYNFAPQIMTYPNGASHEQQQVAAPVSQYEPQHYSNPYMHPTYTQADYSGVQYSAVKPVMAKYPTQAYSKQHYYTSHMQPHQQTRYEQHGQKQYEYQYQYIQQPSSQPQAPRYTVEQQYETAQQYQAPYPTSVESQEENTSAEVQTTLQDVSGLSDHEVSQETTSQEDPKTTSAEYGVHMLKHGNQQHYVAANSEADYETKTEYREYGPAKEENTEGHQTHGQLTHTYQQPQVTTSSVYGIPEQNQQQYINSNYLHYAKQLLKSQHEAQTRPIQKETVAVYPNYSRHSSPHYKTHQQITSGHSYSYQNSANAEPETQTIVISENYPSKDHTHAMPYRYNKPERPSNPVQTVNYVTPLPYSASKYQTQYKVMVPQRTLKNQEKVSYVNSHSLPMHLLQSGPNPEYNPEEEYTVSPQYGPPLGSQKAPSYPKNYHSYPKRMTKVNENKEEKTKQENKTTTEKSQPKKSS